MSVHASQPTIISTLNQLKYILAHNDFGDDYYIMLVTIKPIIKKAIATHNQTKVAQILNISQAVLSTFMNVTKNLVVNTSNTSNDHIYTAQSMTLNGNETTYFKLDTQTMMESIDVI